MWISARDQQAGLLGPLEWLSVVVPEKLMTLQPIILGVLCVYHCLMEIVRRLLFFPSSSLLLLGRNLLQWLTQWKMKFHKPKWHGGKRVCCYDDSHVENRCLICHPSIDSVPATHTSSLHSVESTKKIKWNHSTLPNVMKKPTKHQRNEIVGFPNTPLHHCHDVSPITQHHAFLRRIALRVIESPLHLDVALGDLAMQVIDAVCL